MYKCLHSSLILAIFTKGVCTSVGLIYRVVDRIYSAAAAASRPDQRCRGHAVVVQRGELTVMDGKLAVVDGDRRHGLVQIPTMRPHQDVGWAAATGPPRRRRLPLAGEQACEGVSAAVASASALPDTRVRAGSPAAAAACGMGEGEEKNATAEDYNPQPVMTQQQKEEQQKLLETYERGNAWVEVKEQKRSKPKSKKDIELLDLNSYTTVDSMTVTQADRFTILGEKGARLQQIIQLCGNDVKIELSHRPAKPLANASEEPMTIDIQGTEQQIKLAKKIITELTAKGYSTDLTPDTIEWLCRIAASDVPKIMGPKAQYVKTIQDKTGVKIVVPPKDEEDKSAKKSAKGGDDEKKITVRVIGQEQQVNEAKEAVRLLVQFGYSPLTHENFEQITVDFPTEYRKYLLMSFNSSDAALIHKIQQLTNCKLILPQKEVRPIVHIVGPAKDVYTAASQLKQIIDKLKQPVVDVFLPGFEGTDFSKNELW